MKKEAPRRTTHGNAGLGEGNGPEQRQQAQVELTGSMTDVERKVIGLGEQLEKGSPIDFIVPGLNDGGLQAAVRLLNSLDERTLANRGPNDNLSHTKKIKAGLYFMERIVPEMGKLQTATEKMVRNRNTLQSVIRKFPLTESEKSYVLTPSERIYIPPTHVLQNADDLEQTATKQLNSANQLHQKAVVAINKIKAQRPDLWTTDFENRWNQIAKSLRSLGIDPEAIDAEIAQRAWKLGTSRTEVGDNESYSLEGDSHLKINDDHPDTDTDDPWIKTHLRTTGPWVCGWGTVPGLEPLPSELTTRQQRESSTPRAGVRSSFPGSDPEHNRPAGCATQIQ